MRDNTHHNEIHRREEHAGGHDHSHGLVDPSIVRSRAGAKAVSLSFLSLLASPPPTRS
ncbi:MAG: hypothetical protein AAB899_00420 [Patescibacteria group bacterium]